MIVGNILWGGNQRETRYNPFFTLTTTVEPQIDGKPTLFDCTVDPPFAEIYLKIITLLSAVLILSNRVSQCIEGINLIAISCLQAERYAFQSSGSQAVSIPSSPPLRCFCFCVITTTHTGIKFLLFDLEIPRIYVIILGKGYEDAAQLRDEGRCR